MNAVIQSGTVASGEPFRINRIDHTGFTVSSLEDSLAFWVEALGFKHLYTWTFETGPFIEEMVGVPGAALRLAMLEGPGHMIELLEYTSPNDRKNFKPRSCDVGSVHVAFYVDNMDALLARVASLGWLPVGNIQTVESGEREGLRLTYVRAPDGITIEFLELPDHAPNEMKKNVVAGATKEVQSERRTNDDRQNNFDRPGGCTDYKCCFGAKRRPAAS